jgi:hypothetical protein
MSSMRLVINNIDAKFSASYIVNMFWKQNIAQVSSITLMPYLTTVGLKKIAVIDIRYWCDTEVAYNFIQRLRVPEGEARLVYADDQWWPVHVYTLEYHFNKDPYYTTLFPVFYYEEDTSAEDEANARMLEEAIDSKKYDWLCCAV